MAINTEGVKDFKVMKILVIGAFGSLGQDIVKIFSSHGHDVVAWTQGDLDITNHDQVFSKVAELRPDLLINCAAYNAVDKVEEPEAYAQAYAVNALGPQYLSEIAKVLDIPFVHYSSDYVFDGNKSSGYLEVDEPRPISKYGETKFMGEKLALATGGKVFIVRTSRLFGKRGLTPDSKESFVDLIARLAAEKPELSIVNEEVGCPTYTPDLALATFRLLTTGYAPGIYHLVNDGEGVTWYEFANEIFNLLEITTPRKPVTAAEFSKPAPRPKFSVLVNTKFLKLRHRQLALRAYLLGE